MGKRGKLKAMQKKICFVGCRVRPFMENSFLHGYEVRGADGFNDWDAARFGELAPNESMQGSCFPQILRQYRFAGDSPVIFCGPVEIEPSLIDKASKEFTVLNPTSSAVAMCRNLAFLQEQALDGIRFPKVAFDSGGEGGWLLKDSTSAGGVGVTDYTGSRCNRDRYRQKFIAGVSIGATFLSGDKTALMGLTRHIGQVKEFGQTGYLYGGLCYPAVVDESVTDCIGRFGERVSAAASLTGWWGADFILTQDGPYLLEINPRFTASMELIAAAHAIDLVDTQVAAIKGDMIKMIDSQMDGYRATAVCYAKEDCMFDGSHDWFELGARDIPHNGSAIKKGEPVISLYADAGSADDCSRLLKEQAARLYSGLRGGHKEGTSMNFSGTTK